MKMKVFLLFSLLVPSATLSVSAYSDNSMFQWNMKQANLGSFIQQTSSVVTQEYVTNQAEPLVFKILNLNIQVGLHPEWKDVMKEESPDIAFLDETSFWENSLDEDYLGVLDELNAYFTNEDPYSGVVIDEVGDNAGSTIISRFPIVSSHQFINYPADDGTVKDFQRNFLDVVVDIDGVQVHVVGGHFKCCEDGIEIRARTMEELINYLDDLGDVPIIFTGDFNSDSPQDIGLVDRVFSTLGDLSISMLLNNSHPKGPEVHTWLDVYRELNPHTPGYTYEDKTFNSRIDYYFVNDFFFDKLVSSKTILTPSALAVWGGNDHFPVDAVINMNPELADLRPPFRPYDLRGIVVGATQFSLSWAPNLEADFVDYNVYRDGILVEQTTSTTYEDSGLTSGVIYYYQVSAVDNSTNESFLAHPLYVNTNYGIITAPAAPVLQGTAGGAQAILNWTLVDDGGFEVDFYTIYRTTESGLVNNNFIYQNETTEMSWVDTRAWADKKWYYYVVAHNKLGDGNNSEIIEVIPTAVTSVSGETSKKEDNPFLLSPILVALLSGAVIVPIQRKKYSKSK